MLIGKYETRQASVEMWCGCYYKYNLYICVYRCMFEWKQTQQTGAIGKQNNLFIWWWLFTHETRDTHWTSKKKKTNQMAKNDERVRATSTRSIAIRRCWDAMRARVNIIRSEIHLDIVRAALWVSWLGFASAASNIVSNWFQSSLTINWNSHQEWSTHSAAMASLYPVCVRLIYSIYFYLSNMENTEQHPERNYRFHITLISFVLSQELRTE